jgi:hypothetical protein
LGPVDSGRFSGVFGRSALSLSLSLSWFSRLNSFHEQQLPESLVLQFAGIASGFVGHSKFADAGKTARGQFLKFF